MKVEKIELIGFKSFAEKTVFELHPGITCIVGPNGCGKSNIVDAFRWVLGEQSAKTLRGDKMQEVIFNGSETKKPRGMAEVTLYISIPEPEGNGDTAYRTVTVTRRLYRSGESEYLINRQICRLRDIREMFLDTGLEMKSYSILEQGTIGEIINAKPQDRRFLIEEVAGIMKYKVRKAEAEAKLQTSRYNLQRIEDILSEVKRHRNSLQRQAKKAERYTKLIEELKKLELRTSKRQFLSLSSKLRGLSDEIAELKNLEAEKRALITKKETSLQTRKSLLTEKEKELYEKELLLQQYERRASEIEKTHDLTAKEIEHLIETIHSLQEAILRAERNLKEKEELLRATSERQQQFSTEIERLRAELSKQTEESRSLQDEIYQIEDELESKRKELFSITDSIGSIRNTINTLNLNIENTETRLLKAKRELEESERRTKELEAEIANTGEEIKSKNKSLEEFRMERERLTEELLKKKSILQSLSHKRIELIGELNSIDSKIKTLTGMITLPLNRDKFIQQGVNLLRPLSEVIEVPEKYEKATEAVLSERIKGLLVSTPEELKKAAEIVTREGIQRTTFLLSSTSTEPHAEPSNTDTIIPLSSLVKTETEFEGTIKDLLKNCYLVDSIDKGIEITQKNKGIKAVTLNGEVIEAGCILTCGKTSRLLPITREIKELKERFDITSKEKKDTEENIQKIQHSIDEIKERLKEIEAKIVSEEKEISLLQAESRRYKEEMERFIKKSDMLRLEIEQLKQENIDSKKALEEYKQKLSEQERLKERINRELLSLQERRNEKRTEMDIKTEAVTQTRITLKGISEKMDAIKREKASIKDEINRISIKKKNLNREIVIKKELINEKKKTMEESKKELKELIFLTDNLRREISTWRDELKSTKEEVSAEEGIVRELSRELESIIQRLHQREVEEVEISAKINSIIENINEKYNVDLKEIEVNTSEGSEEEDMREIERLRKLIHDMEPVNVAAMEEYKQVEERFQFLSSQHADIVQSINELETAIDRIDRTTKQKLKEAFDRLNQKFNEVFRMLFGGGDAELRLTEDNLLNAGIEIIAQPPGKKLQNINLLSGGEKALTALALMFAGFLLKPTPVCILDEADSPLDDNNTEKFKMMLKNLSKDIQFIVITHNKRTMEAADYLYGITMEEPGVSKVLSLQLT
jgi:chromosome segregation protein